MAYSREAHELLDQALEVLKTKKGYLAHSYMLGLLMPNVNLTDATRIAKMIEEMKGDK
jgi:hypothetical protein